MGNHGGAPRPGARGQRAAAVRARRDTLDARFGAYSRGRLRDLVADVYRTNPEVGFAISAHLGGGVHYGLAEVLRQLDQHPPVGGVTEADRASARAAFARMRELAEWSILHEYRRSAADGSLRLYRGVKARPGEDLAAKAARWRSHLASAGERRSTSWTSSRAIAREFGPSPDAPVRTWGGITVSAHVPASAVLWWSGMEPGYQVFGHEREFVVGPGALANVIAA